MPARPTSRRQPGRVRSRFHRRIPRGYESVLGQGGVNLSGGQKRGGHRPGAGAEARGSHTRRLHQPWTRSPKRRSWRDPEVDRRVPCILITQRISAAAASDRVLVPTTAEPRASGPRAAQPHLRRLPRHLRRLARQGGPEWPSTGRPEPTVRAAGTRHCPAYRACRAGARHGSGMGMGRARGSGPKVRPARRAANGARIWVYFAASRDAGFIAVLIIIEARSHGGTLAARKAVDALSALAQAVVPTEDGIIAALSSSGPIRSLATALAALLAAYLGGALLSTVHGWTMAACRSGCAQRKGGADSPSCSGCPCRSST